MSEGAQTSEIAPRLTEAERQELAAGWPDFWKCHAAVERIVAERRSADMARALRGQRDFFRAIDMTVAADHCEQAALAWESQAVTDALRTEEAGRG